MALRATVVRLEIDLSDVDRGVYEKLDLRLGQHPSETERHLATRALAYALAYEEGIAFSKGGLSSTDEPAISVVDPTGVRLAWIDVGAPAAERLHRASKATPRVLVFTTAFGALAREAKARAIHRAETIEVYEIDGALADALERSFAEARSPRWEIARTDGVVYATIDGAVTSGPVVRRPLVA